MGELRGDIAKLNRFIRQLERRWPAGLTVLKTRDASRLLSIEAKLANDVTRTLDDAAKDSILKLAAGIDDGSLKRQAERIHAGIVSSYAGRVGAAIAVGAPTVDVGPLGNVLPMRAGYIVSLKDYEGILARVDQIQDAAEEIPALFRALFLLGKALFAAVAAAIKAIIALLEFALGVVSTAFKFSTPLLLGLVAGGLILVGPPVYRRLKGRRE